ncbi:hypothetical protein NMG60_11009917 [Bertholletia excelsa]
MQKVPARFKRVAEAFDDVARARLCESSGSEHSPEDSVDLSDLVISFIERESRRERNSDEADHQEEQRNRSEFNGYCIESDYVGLLRGLFGSEDDEIKQRILAEIKKTSCKVGTGSPLSDFKRRLMTELRDRGFDAGLCKSKWGRSEGFPSGSYEYVDVEVTGTRYIIEVNLAGEFEIARATEGYASLLGLFPPIFVGKVEELKQVVNLMCAAIKDSMGRVDMHAPPWRRRRYMTAKWFGPYRRTTNEAPATRGCGCSSGSTRKRLVGFVPGSTGLSYHCRDDFAWKSDLKKGQLALAFSSTNAFSVNT